MMGALFWKVPQKHKIFVTTMPFGKNMISRKEGCDPSLFPLLSCEHGGDRDMNGTQL
jgi:hypothetical protein